MANCIEETVSGLEDLETVTGVWEQAERRLAEGDPAFLADLGTALTNRYASRWMQVWQCHSVFDYLLRLLSLAPGTANVEQALRLNAGGGDREGVPKRVQYLASLLAAGQEPQDLAIVFSEGGSPVGATDELRACLVNELVLRGVSVERIPGIDAWSRSPHWNSHRLGWLPLSLTVLEGRPPLPRYSSRGTSYHGPSWQPDGPGMRADRAAPVVAPTETTTDPVASHIATAVANWAYESNGRFEARVYELADDVPADAIASVLSSLDLTCLRGLDSHRRFVFPCTPARAWQMLFTAASMGGAHNAGERGAYGRLAAWRSVAALTGAPADASPAVIEQRAYQCAWHYFDAETDWFERTWGLGLVVVAPDRRRLAVLAATDTD